MTALEERLAQIRRLEKKYGRAEAELAAYLDECVQKLDDLEYVSDRIVKLQKQLSSDASAAKKGRRRPHSGPERARRSWPGALSPSSGAEHAFGPLLAEITPVGGERGFERPAATRCVFSLRPMPAPSRGASCAIASAAS
jgi:hypothetical protein